MEAQTLTMSNYYKLPADKSSYHSEELSTESQFKGNIDDFDDLNVISKIRRKCCFLYV